MATLPSIYICADHNDMETLAAIRSYLRILERRGMVTIWDRTRIQPGEGAHLATERAIEAAHIVLLLISPDFLESEEIQAYILSRILERRQQGQLTILPITIRAVPWLNVPALADISAWPPDGNALYERSKEQVDSLLASLADEIARRAGSLLDESMLVQSEGMPSGEAEHRTGDRSVVFISHSKADLDFAESIRLRLERRGYAPWFDAERLKGGVIWRQAIDEALRQAVAVIVVVSPDARTSEYVTYEWAFAVGAGVPVIPLLYRPTALHPYLAAIQYLNFYQRRPWALLMQQLDELRLAHRSR